LRDNILENFISMPTYYGNLKQIRMGAAHTYVYPAKINLTIF